jgi:hypothetical protein
MGLVKTSGNFVLDMYYVSNKPRKRMTWATGSATHRSEKRSKRTRSRKTIVFINILIKNYFSNVDWKASKQS